MKAHDDSVVPGYHGIPDRPQPIDRCAWYLRVSTPKQKLEHQREHVVRYCDQAAIIIPTDRQFEDKEKRHKSNKRQDFQRLLEMVKARQLDWIIICSFDRWGVADVDEFFEFRRLLLKHDVQLWSVVDQMNLTGITEGDYFRIVAMAIGATKYVEQMAEKNILKMIEMAKQGFAATGNAAFGTDLVCYPLHDLCRPLFRVVRTRYIRPHGFRTIFYSDDSRVTRDDAGVIVGHGLKIVKEDVSGRMPVRDKKTTGYRLEPSVEIERIQAVNLAYELYDAGMGFHEISRQLWNRGLKHYDKPFGYHGIETILSNPVYIGMPAWGKLGVGTYRVLHGGAPTRIKRKASDRQVIRKDEAQFVQPLKPIFNPMVSLDLWKRVHDRIKARSETNPHFGKRRTRSRSSHPLNGKLYCPDCDSPMVIGSSTPKRRSGTKTRCFNCGTYRRFCRVKCNANTVGWDHLDTAVKQLLKSVKGRIDRLIADPEKVILQESWAKECELTRICGEINTGLIDAIAGKQHDELLSQPPDPKKPILEQAIELYNQIYAHKTEDFEREITSIEEELERIGQLLLEGIPSQTVKKKFYERLAELEARKRSIEPMLVRTTDRAEMLIEQLKAIRQTISDAQTVSLANLLDTFVEKVIPRFDVRIVGKGQRRAILRAVEFIPRKTTRAKEVMPSAMEIGVTHKGRD